ncbi:MAG: quinolinate synthase NadA [Promethearchaeota archaeon]|nr:MAG: quinolinate synthase NadA [Candidatus Lokiarchaeota archaeon]
MENSKQIQQEILDLKDKKDVVILAHYYQSIEIQEIADFLGDSLGLSRIAKEEANTNYIIFAGVIFMAETASILNQDKHILVPNVDAFCELADFLTPELVDEYKKKYPGLPVVTYVNSTAAVKSKSDICCTSSNAANIVKKIKKEFDSEAVLFGPDSNLADYAESISGVKIIKMPENGHCYVHSDLTLGDLKLARKEYPGAKILVHPECTREVRETADFVGSTAQMYNYVKENGSKFEDFMIGTEHGLLERLAADFPNNKFHHPKNKMICHNMKKNKLESIKFLLQNLENNPSEIKVPKKIAEKALIPIEKMLKYST